MHYVVQENLFQEENYSNLIDGLDRLNLSYEIVKCLPFIDDITYKTDRLDVFPFGSVKMSRVSKKSKWLPGSQLNSNHDYMVYKDYYKDNLLNYDSKIIEFGDLDFFSKELFFARPTEDSKVFTGRVFDYGEWVEFRDDALTNGHSTSLTSKTKIQISSVKKIFKEFRFWIVGGKIITGSQYKLGNRLTLNDDIDKEVYTYCQKMVDIFQLNEAFVMDIALTEKGYSIVECGCINCAGFYKANMQKLLISLEEYFNY